MRIRRLTKWLCFGLLTGAALSAQQPAAPHTAELRLQIASAQSDKRHAAPAVAWLEPVAGTAAVPFPPHGHYTLLQKNRTFIPHLQVVPVGSVVQFPNDDPFFHNVFSLFDGKRFDLGLYEAGSSKSVTFSREGVSYIFCNIHSEMSAVIISLSTPLYAIADPNGNIVIDKIPRGDYQIHLWVEGVPQSVLNGLSRRVHFDEAAVNLGQVKIPIMPLRAHDNKFGKPYEQSHDSPY